MKEWCYHQVQVTGRDAKEISNLILETSLTLEDSESLHFEVSISEDEILIQNSFRPLSSFVVEEDEVHGPFDQSSPPPRLPSRVEKKQQYQQI